MTLSLHHIVLAIVGALSAAGLARPGEATASDYPTPRAIGQRKLPVAESTIQRTAATETPAQHGTELGTSNTPRPKTVRVDGAAPIGAAVHAEDVQPIIISRGNAVPVSPRVPVPSEPRELPSTSLIMPTPRTIARPRPYTGPRVETISESARPASQETTVPTPLGVAPAPAASATAPREAVSPSDQTRATLPADGNTLRVVTKNVTPIRGLPRVKVSPEIARQNYDDQLSQPGGIQPMPPRDEFKPSDDDLKRWFTPLNSIGISAQPEPGDMPKDYSGNLFAVDEQPMRKDWPEREFNWEAPELWHQPFYFDDVPLERYGQSVWPARQAWISGMRFYMTFPILPVKLWADPPFTKVASYGYYRVGDDNPAVAQRPRKPYGFGPWGYGQWRGAGSLWYVPPAPMWSSTPQ